ncbi:MAG: WYL domain-containing protein [Bacteroidota bacterium]
MKPKRTERIVRLLLRVLTSPYTHTRKSLAKDFNVDISRIKEDFQLLRNIGIHVDQQKQHPYAYAIITEKGFKELQYLNVLTESEQAEIHKALHASLGSTKKANYILGKLSGLYNFQKLGLRALRRHALERIDNLEAAKKAKKQVILKNYNSNSGEKRDRHLEVFLIDAELDTIQAFDCKIMKNRHFRLSRIESVVILDTPWQFKKDHKEKLTDVFRIASAKDQIRIHLILKNQAYNFLAENYPLALREIHPAPEPNTWYFETAVNPDFYGLTNFIMAHFEHIEIVEPIGLQEHIRKKAASLLSRLA